MKLSLNISQMDKSSKSVQIDEISTMLEDMVIPHVRDYLRIYLSLQF